MISQPEVFYKDEKEIAYQIPKSDLEELKRLCIEIMYSEVRYNENQLEMANEVIINTQSLATDMKNILDSI